MMMAVYLASRAGSTGREFAAIIVLAFFLTLQIPSFLSAQEMSVEQAIEIGLANNYSIGIARQNLQSAANNSRLGTSGFLPTLDASGSLQYSTQSRESNSSFSSGDSDDRNINAQLALNWTLFDGMRMFIDKRRYAELERQTSFQTRELIENAVVSILRNYFAVVQQEQLLGVAREALAVSETRFQKVGIRNDLGGATSADLYSAEVALNNDRATVINLELALAVAQKNLNLILARDPAAAVSVVTEIQVEPLALELDQLLAKAQERNSTIQAARQRRSIAGHNIDLARAPYLPRLAMNAQYGLLDRSSTTDNPLPIPGVPATEETSGADASIGLTLSINLFNAMRDDIALQNAQIAAASETLRLRDAESQIEGLIHENYQTFLKQMELVRLEERNVVVAQTSLELQEDRYALGTSTSLEFRDAQTNLYRSQTALIAARYQARITRLELERLIGELTID